MNFAIRRKRCISRFLGQSAYVLRTLALAPFLALAQNAKPVRITVHADQSIGPYKPIWNFFGTDEPNYIEAPNGQKLLHELSALSPVPVYFRPHNLLTTGNGEGSLRWGSTNGYTET